MKPALVLVDLQNDFLNHPELAPPETSLLAVIKNLLAAFRKSDIPVIHVHTQVKPDGSDRMPHWKKNNTWKCVENTEGVKPPAGCEPVEGEARYTKQFFSAFTNPDFAGKLEKLGIDNLVIAGLYLHGCVRCTAIDACQSGFKVTIIDDAVGSCDPVQAELSRQYLQDRVAVFTGFSNLFDKQEPGVTVTAGHSPANEDLLDLAFQQAVQSAEEWGAGDRTTLLQKWYETVEKGAGHCEELIIRDIAKPRRYAREEVKLGLSFIKGTIDLIGRYDFNETGIAGGKFDIRHCPLGVVGLITPWNNPFAISIGKMAPALACGNAIVWKPSPASPAVPEFIMETLRESGILPGLVNVVAGGAEVARRMIMHRDIHGISFTGGVETGRGIAALCTCAGKPLQAELGGNNAAIIMEDFNFKKHAKDLALSAFSFSGQRCTSIQRFIVVDTIYDDFIETMISATESLHAGDPGNEQTEIGPLISKGHRDAVLKRIKEACDMGAVILTGGVVPAGHPEGAWLSPALMDSVSPESEIARKEIFGPVAMIIRVRDIEQAIAANNAVDYGLVATLCSNNRDYQSRFIQKAQAGILNIWSGPLKIHPHAPFGGWKKSRIGPPEHGAWDFSFYTRPQAIYK